MRIPAGMAQQASDFVAYLLFPLLCLLLPARFSLRQMQRISGWEWLLAADARRALEGARNHLDIEDGASWRRRWKQVELLDVRDLFMLTFGRAGSVLAEIERPDNFERVRNCVMAGMHWGPAISLLRLLSEQGMEPTFPYRPPEKALLRRRPFYYFYSARADRYVKRTLGERAVTTGGAGKVLRGLLEKSGSICVLMDAPAQKGRPAMDREVLGTPATLNTGFPAMFVEQGKEYVLYAMNLAGDGTAGKRLEIEGPFRSGTVEEYLDRYADFVHRHLSADSAQWRIWRAEHQVWRRDVEKTDYQ